MSPTSLFSRKIPISTHNYLLFLRSTYFAPPGHICQHFCVFQQQRHNFHATVVLRDESRIDSTSQQRQRQNSDPGRLTGKDLKDYRIGRIIQHWETNSTNIISGDAAKELRAELSVHSLFEWRQLVNQSQSAWAGRRKMLLSPNHRRIVRDLIRQSNDESLSVAHLVRTLEQSEYFQNIPRIILCDMVHKGIAAESRRALSRKQRNVIRNHVHASLHKDIPRMCDELQEHVDVPRRLLHGLVTDALYSSLKNKGIVYHARQVVAKHMQQSKHWDDIPQLCDELQISLPQIPRTPLQRMVKTQFEKMARRSLQSEYREVVRRYVMGRKSDSIEDLCQAMRGEFRHIGVPESAWYPIVKSIRNTQRISAANRPLSRMQKKEIRSHVDTLRHTLDAKMLYDELESRFGLPRTMLYALVRPGQDATQSIRKRVKTFVEKSAQPFDVQSMLKELRNQDFGVSTSVLHSVLISAVKSTELDKVVTDEMVSLVRKHVDQSPHPDDIGRMVDEMREQYHWGISHQTLHTLVRSASLRVFRRKLAPEHIELAKSLVGKSPDRSPVDLTDELKMQLPADFPRALVYQLVLNQIAKLRRKENKQ